MPDPSTPERPDLNAALAAVERETGWHCWRGVIALLYANRPRTSPPLVVRAPDPCALREAILKAEAGLG